MIVHRKTHEVCDQNRIKTRKIVPPSSRTIALLTITTMKIESFIIFSLALGNIRNIQVNISVKWIKIISLSTLAVSSAYHFKEFHIWRFLSSVNPFFYETKNFFFVACWRECRQSIKSINIPQICRHMSHSSWIIFPPFKQFCLHFAIYPSLKFLLACETNMW